MKYIQTLLLIITLTSFSQNRKYQITYDFTQNAKDIKLITNIKTYLTGNGQVSVYEEDFANIKSKSSDENLISIKTLNNPIFYKDLQNKKAIFNDQIKMKFFNIVDAGITFDWKIEQETKIILGYNCQKATIRFRGRDFVVYFTSEIPFSDGPWKFSGLPGLILEVKSDDPLHTYDIIAEKIEFKDSKEKIDNIYLNQDTITYEEFLKIYMRKYEESISNMDSNGFTRGMNKGFMEFYITE
jgi:GLPGLI family protein